MAEAPYELNGQVENSTSPNGTVSVTWSDLNNGDMGQSYSGHSYSDRSVQVFGAFGAGGNCRIEGSNDGVNWAPLSDPQGDALNLAAAGISAVTEITRFIRPNVTGDSSTDLTVVMIGRR